MAVVVLVALAGAGCSSDATAPAAQTITLPDSATAAAGGSTPTTFPAAEVHLRVGQRLLVATTRNDQPAAWQTGMVADPHVVRQDPELTVHGCPAQVAGCSADVDEVYTAAAPGTTTVNWEFHNFVCSATAKPPIPCVMATKTAHVTVVR
jgi:hypothetical protein